MIGQVSAVLSQMIGWVGEVVDSLLAEGALNSLLPLLLVGVAGSLLMFGAKIIRMFMWGN